jgi:methylamine---glutamate N-methyltransferase subunit B
VAAVSVATATTPVELDCDVLSTRAVNAALAELPEGAHARVLNPGGRHNLVVGLRRRVRVEVAGNAGYYLAGLCDGPEVVCAGFVGTGLAENLMGGTVRVAGDASASAAASAHGGTVIVAGDASARAGISLKGGTLLVGGSCGHMCGFMAQAGVILVGGDAGEALGDSLYEATIYVAGSIRSLGADAQVTELEADDVARVAELCTQAGFDHVDPENVTKVTSARQLYHFDTQKDHSHY